MKLVTYKNDSRTGLGLVHNNEIYDLNNHDSSIPSDMLSFLQMGEDGMNKARAVESSILSGSGTVASAYNETGPMR